jgi:hypothetical protein
MTPNDVKEEMDAYFNIVNLLQRRCERLGDNINSLFGK